MNDNKNTVTRSKKKLFIRIILLVLLVIIIAEFIRSNTVIDVENITYKNEKIPKGFDGAVIVQISDYHNHGGSYEDRVIEKTAAQKPDYIFITGDIADSIRTDTESANSFLTKLSEISKCYLVWGNHDAELSKEDKEKIKKCCEDNDITVLENQTGYLERNGDKLLLTGTSTELYHPGVDKMLEDYPEEDIFSVWLHHYPEDIDEILKISEKAGCKADLVFTGHAHGGLFGFPFPNGLYAPGQGLMPKYTSGEYNIGGSEMIVSRGLGNSGYTMRFADSFHLVAVRLETE